MSEYISDGVELAPKHAYYTSDMIYELCGNSWMKEHDLALRLHEVDSSLTPADYGLLISAVRGPLPLVMTVRHHMPDMHRDRITKTTVVVDYFIVGSEESSANRMYVRYFGFGHHEYLADIISLDAPDTEYSYEN